MKWCEHHFRNCLLLAWTWGSESGTGLFASLVQSWWCNVKLFAARLIDLSCQTGFEKHSIFKVKSEFKSLQPLCLWEGGSPWMGGCMRYRRVEFLNISQDHLWQDVEIRECSCHWCWDTCWKYALCSVHRARPWASPHDVALGSSPSLEHTPSPGSPHPWVLVPSSMALCLLPLSAFPCLLCSPPVSPYPGSHGITIPVNIQALQAEKKPAAVPRWAPGQRRQVGIWGCFLLPLGIICTTALKICLVSELKLKSSWGKRDLSVLLTFPVTFPCCLEGAVRARYLPYIKLYHGCREGRWNCN